MKYFFLFFLFLLPASVWAQQPKMHLKFFGGINSHKFIYRLDSIESETLSGYQFGFGFRVLRRKAFGEIDFSFTRFGFTFVAPPELEIEEEITMRVNSFELPINLGYIPVKKPIFKWYLYGGLVNRFTVRGILNVAGEKVKFRPKAVNLPIYNLDVQVGTQFDVAMLNFDVHYKLGVTNGLRDNIRTNLHSFYLNAGFIF